MALWTKITEGVVARKATNINVPEMDDMAAQLVINEALYEAGAASFAAIEISESIADFGVEADARRLSAMQYIAEAFSVGGFFGKIIEFLKKMWNTIVNYFKPLIGNKFGASGNIAKLIAKFEENMKVIAAKIAGNEYKTDDTVKVKRYELKDAGIVAGTLINPDLYLKTDMLDSVTSDLWNDAVGNSDKKGVGFNIYNITSAAASEAKKVSDAQKESVRVTAEDLGKNKTKVDNAVSDLKSLTSKLSLGDKGAAETLMILLEKKWKDNSGLKKIFEDAKAKDAKSLTELLRKLLEHLFPASAETHSPDAKMAADILKTTHTSVQDSIKTESASGATGLVDPVKGALQYCTDILDQLNKAGETIKSISKSGKDRVAVEQSTSQRVQKADGTYDNVTIPGKVSDDQKPAVDYAEKMTEFGNELTKLSSNMQAVVTKGMDAAAVLIETIYKEMVGQTELIIKAATGSREKAKVAVN